MGKNVRVVALWFAIGLLSSSTALSQTVSYGPEIAGLRLGMTEDEARRVPGISFKLMEKYRSFVTYQVNEFSFLGDTGTLTVQFDDGKGLTKLQQRWSYKGAQQSQAPKQFQLAQEWAEMPAESTNKISSSLIVASRQTADFIVKTTFTSVEGLGSSANLEIHAAREPPRVAMKGEAPLRHKWSDAEDAFAESFERAKKASGVLSPYHGVYASQSCRAKLEVGGTNAGIGTFAAMFLRLRVLIWTEGSKMYWQAGTATEPREIENLDVVGADTLPVDVSDGSKKVIRVFVVDGIERTTKSSTSWRYFFGSDEVYMAKKTAFGTEKDLLTFVRCEKI